MINLHSSGRSECEIESTIRGETHDLTAGDHWDTIATRSRAQYLRPMSGIDKAREWIGRVARQDNNA